MYLIFGGNLQSAMMNMNRIGRHSIGSTSPPSQPTNAKKKRRTNSNGAAGHRSTQRAATRDLFSSAATMHAAADVATAMQSMHSMQSMQDFNIQEPSPIPHQEKKGFVPSQMAGFGDTLIANNPFDDAPQRGLNFAMQNGTPQVHPHHMGHSQIRGMNPMQVGNINPMMPRIGNPAMSHMNPVRPNQNLPPMGNMNSMKNMRSNMPPGAMSTGTMPSGRMSNINDHMSMNLNHMMNPQLNDPPMNGSGMNVPPMNEPEMNGPPMNSPMNGLINNSRESPGANMNHGIRSPLNGFIGSPLNSMSPNHMNNGSVSVSAMNTMNLSQNLLQPHANAMNTIRSPLHRPQIMPITNMNSADPGSMMGLNQMNNLNMKRSSINNITNANINNGNPRGQLGTMRNLMSNVPNNLPGKPHSYGMNIGTSILRHELQGPASLGPKSMVMPVSTEKVFPPDQPMVFDQQNPHAPPISPCGVCHKEVHATDQAIFCESGCNFWFHRRCTGLTELAYVMLMYEAYAEWACNKCMQTKHVPLVKLKP